MACKNGYYFIFWGLRKWFVSLVDNFHNDAVKLKNNLHQNLFTKH